MKTGQEMDVVCCVCGKVKDAKGVWTKPSSPISDKNNLSHGYCHVCALISQIVLETSPRNSPKSPSVRARQEEKSNCRMRRLRKMFDAPEARGVKVHLVAKVLREVIRNFRQENPHRGMGNHWLARMLKKTIRDFSEGKKRPALEQAV